MTERRNLNVGLLPLRIEVGNKDILSKIGFGHKIIALLNKLLEETQKFNVMQLTWPHVAETEKIDTSGYNQLLKTAKKEQTDVLLITALTSLNFQIWRLPAYFGVLFKFINFIRIKVTIEGAVLDIRQQKVIANLKEGGDKYAFFYKGAEVNGLSNLDQTLEEDFITTLTGKASTEALEKIASQLVNIREKISEVSSIGINMPKGLHFSRDRYLFKIDRNFDQWAEVEVINNDDKTHRFIVKTERDYEDVAIGFIGRGSADSICELEAGDIKRVRLVVMAAQAQNAVYNVPVHLYSMDGKSSVDISHASLDKADIALEILRPELHIEVKKVADDPFTLTQTYEITNNGTQVTDLSVYPAESLKGSILFFPIIDKLLLNAGASVQFSVAPVLHKDFRNVNGDVVITGNGSKKLIPVSFSIPTGKKLFEVDVGSRGMYSSSTTYCTNIGGGETRIGVPPPPKQEPPLPESKIKKIFGDPGGHISTIDLPIIGKIQCHSKIVDILKKVFTDIEMTKLDYQIKFDGAYNKRRMYCKDHEAYCDHKPWSHHSWGIAIDLNADTNSYGKKGDMPIEIVDIFKKHGFIWGGYWKTPDPMHFECVGEYGKCKGEGC